MKSTSCPLAGCILLAACTVCAAERPRESQPGKAEGAEMVKPPVLNPDGFRRHVSEFNAHDNEGAASLVSNASAWAWMKHNVPLFECPDKDIQEIYYFRWWTYRKHIKQTPAGLVVTEFLPPVGWAGKYNTINCAAGHHIYEGRWMRDPNCMDDYCAFWFRGGGEPRRYSFWAADAVYNRCLVSGDLAPAIDLLGDLIANYEAWEKTHREPNGLFWQIDDRDGMEVSIGGSGHRPTINSYMYGDAAAIAKIAEAAGKKDVAERFRLKAEQIKQLVQEKLWDKDALFFKVRPRDPNARLADVRELHGYTPWYFNLPDKTHSAAWKQLMDAQGFYAPFGPTTAERRHKRFMFKSNHECLWNGPSWPYSTAVTLTAMANLLNNYKQDAVGRKDYLDLLRIYARSQHLKLDDGTVVPWIDEDLDGDTGAWIARDILLKRGVKDRGKDYNHSTYCDLVISGLVGLRPRADETIEVNPLVPDGAWDYFCLDGVLYHGRVIAILYDRKGDRYGKGPGLRILADGKEIASSPQLARLTAPLPPRTRPIAPEQTSAGWVKYQGNPVLGGSYGTCFDVAVLKEDQTYRMWFSWRPKASVALVQSNDGIHWGEPRIVLGPNKDTDWENDINRQTVVRRDGLYHMWYTGQSKRGSLIGYATSPDGLNWTKWQANPVFKPDRASDWEKHKVTACQVVRQGDWHVMFYIGFRDEPHAQIGLARSRDGITDWQRHPANPIIRPGRYMWDHDACYKPFAVLDGKRWLLWYNGRHGAPEQIGLAIHEGEDLGFPPFPASLDGRERSGAANSRAASGPGAP